MGDQLRDYVPVANAYHALLLAATFIVAILASCLLLCAVCRAGGVSEDIDDDVAGGQAFVGSVAARRASVGDGVEIGDTEIVNIRDEMVRQG